MSSPSCFFFITYLTNQTTIEPDWNTNMNALEQMKNSARPTVKICVDSCRKLVAQLDHIKNAILADFRGMFGAQEHIVRLALNEAEALAWQTDYPHLLFPTLAMEKVQEVAAWNARQRSIRGAASMSAFGA
jgi:hypothetical protein